MFRGGAVFMPFETHEAYEAFVTGKVDEYYAEQDANREIYDTDNHHYDEDGYMDEDSMIEKVEISARVKVFWKKKR